MQIPLQLGNWFPSSRFVMALKDSNTYKLMSNFLLRIRTWSRRTIWGDRLFLKFEGPATLLVQSRGSRIRDVLDSEQVNEIADAPAGEALDAARTLRLGKSDASRMGVQGATTSAATEGATETGQPKLSVGSISKDGKVTFEATQEPEKKVV